MRLAPASHPLIFMACIALGTLLVGIAASSDDAAQPAAHGPLDGMAFIGQIGPRGAPDIDDMLFFKDGHFWSKACTQCGFAPAPYWSRQVDGGIEFRGFLESPDRGRFSYLGMVKGDHITVRIDWRRERWYWSVHRELGFEGTLTTKALEMTLDAARRTAAQPPPQANNCLS